MDGLARRALPYKRCLPLIGDPYGFYLTGFHLCSFERPLGGLILCAPNLDRIMLYPSRLRIDLGEGNLADTDDIAGAIKDDRTGTRGTLVHSQNIGFAARHIRLLRSGCGGYRPPKPVYGCFSCL